MRTISIVLLSLLAAAAIPPALAAAPGDTVADRVLGQANLRSLGPYFVDGRVFGAGAVAFDRSAVPNRVYVADSELNRVLGWSDERGLLRGEPADLVLGQPDLATGELFDRNYPSDICRAPSATSFCGLASIAVDPDGNLYVSDERNLRVLEFDRPFQRDARADRVFGQPGFTTRYGFPSGLGAAEIALDPAGNLFLLEKTGHRRLLAYENPARRQAVRAEPDLVVESTGFGPCNNGTQGERLCHPLSLAADAQGTLYVLDSESFFGTRMRVYPRPFAEQLHAAFSVDASLGSMVVEGGLAFDAAGDLLYSANQCFARLAAPITAGSVPECAISRDESSLARLAVDAEGRLFAAQFSEPGDLRTNRLLKFEPPFTKASLPQIVSSPRRTPRSLHFPYAVAVDTSTTPNRLYAADLYQRVLGWRDAAGFASGAPADLVIGARGSRIPESQAQCSAPAADRFCFGTIFGAAGLAVDAAGNLWVADSDNNRVLEFDRPFETDGFADRVLGQRDLSTDSSRGRGFTGLDRPSALALDREGNLYVADVYTARVLLFRDPLRTDAVADRVFGARAEFGCSDPSKRGFCMGLVPETHPGIRDPVVGLAVDGEGNLYVADGGHHRVLIFEDAARSDTVADRVLGQDGRFDTARAGLSASRFFFPGGLALGARGELYVADVYNSRVLEFDHPLQGGAADRVFGQKDFTSGSYELSPATPSSLQYPRGVAIDAEGNLYVADTDHHRVTAYDEP